VHEAKKRITKIYRGITSPLRRLPDFIIIGGKKCGTSSLYNYLARRPDVASAFRKEVHFFDEARERNRLRYRAYFPVRTGRGKSRRMTGEATPYYLFHPLAPARVRKVVPEAKLIAVLRNPVDRAYSHYHHELRRGTEDLSFEEAVGREVERLEGEREKMLRKCGYDSLQARRYSYLSRGVYVDQIQTWREHFPEEQLLILRTEDLFENPQAALGRTLDFLGLPHLEGVNLSKDNRGGYLEIDPATRERLIEYFRPHNERLYEYLGRDFGWDR
jgi:hypothetical protein